MPASASIYYLRHHEIDKSLWDACIDRSENGLIYAKSYYLDKIAHHWDALVLGDYTAAMPLPWKKKYGIKYVYPPPFCQQLGIFSQVSLSETIYQCVLEKVKAAFKFGEYYFNYHNEFSSVIYKNNFVLDLNKEYTTIEKNYRQNLVRNLKKAQRQQLHYLKSNNYTNAINLYQYTYGKRIPHVNVADYNRLQETCSALHEKGEVIIREVKDRAGNLLAVTLCLKDNKRLYLLLPTITAAGRTLAANHFMLDQIIREFSSQPLLLDFEGSDIPGIAHFYQSFGGVNQPYFFQRWNRLPWPLRHLKK